MRDLIGLICWHSANVVLLRPLLLAVRAAFAYFTTSGEEQRSPEHAHTAESDSLCDVDGVRVRRTDSSVTENFHANLAEAQRNYEEAIKTIAQLTKENSELSSYVNLLEDTVKDQEKELRESVENWSLMTNELKQEMMETLTHNEEQEHDVHCVLKSEYEVKTETFEQSESLKVALAEAETKHKQVMESNAQLQKENTKLIMDNEVLQDCLCELEEQHLEDLEEVEEAYRFLQLKYEEALTQRDESLKGPLNKNVEKTQENEVASALVDSERSKLEERVMELEELLHVKQTECKKKTEELQTRLAKAERTHMNVIQANAQLKEEVSDLRSQVAKLQDSVEQKNDKLSEAYMKFSVIIQELEEERKAHSITESQYLKLRKMPTESEETLRVALAEAESKYEQAMASNAQLEKENAKLITDSEVLQDYARELEEQHLEDLEEAEEAYRFLHSKYEEALKQRDESLNECERVPQCADIKAQSDEGNCFPQ
ncbi:ninein-like isoform X3 [Clarias gariepinus]|uniref:ninein-like isoform X3 n=1 Tax=Clarias gariepinus TaxID=13013 RepID=UPI00234C10C1|nr:ninein-like isoform X3 [Clarias gariepinus]